MGIPQKNLWPYDEVKISGDAREPRMVTVSTPWLKFKMEVEADEVPRLQTLIEKLSSEDGAQPDFNDVQWFFQSLASYPLTYVLPRPESFGIDSHEVSQQKLNQTSPVALLRDLCANSNINQAIERFQSRTGEWKWTWDHEAALGFAQVEGGFDPETLFSIARRFHLLNDIEWNKTGEMLEYVRGLKNDPAAFQSASALIVRQNHYITEQCESVLKAGLPTSQSSYAAVSEFIQAEAGHDIILSRALKSLGADAATTKVLDTTVVLMEVFREVAKRNFLAFAMVVDIFERTSYQGGDPLASLLRAGGHDTAARQADIHRDINDSGGHENIALGFLAEMKAVDSEYAQEALRLAEVATLTIHQLSSETLDLLRAN
ncbi:MAG: hypothetical protein ABL958_00875 [Bdellovibrionia bacterium]